MRPSLERRMVFPMGRSNYIFTGSRGSGKSFAALALARRRDCVVFIDPTSTVSEMDYTSTDPDRIAEVVRRYPTFRACLWVGHLDPEQTKKALDVIIRSAEGKDKWVTVIIDEVAVVSPNQKNTESLERSARMGRHTQTSYWFSSQRAVDVSQNLRAQSEMMFVFRTSSARDVESIRREYGKEAAEAVSRLGPFEYIAIDTQTRQWASRAPIRAPRLADG